VKQAIILIVLIIIAGIAAIFIFGNPFTNEIGLLDISEQQPVVIKNIELTDRDFYKIYYTDGYEKSEPKIMVLVIQPDDNYLGSISQWGEQANKHDFALAVIPDWTFEKITEFNIDAHQNLGVNKIVYTGFSHGGYTSCGQGLSNQTYVDAIIPMGAYCRDDDLDGQPQTTPILTIIGAQDNWALGDDLIRPDQRQFSFVTQIDTEYVLIPGIGHQFPTSYMDEVGDWLMENI